MRRLTTLASIAAFAALAASSDAAGGPAAGVSAEEAIPTTLDEALGLLAAARAERDDALTVGKLAIEDLGAQLKAKGEALAETEKALAAANKAAGKGKAKGYGDLKAPPGTFPVTVLRGTVTYTTGSFPAGEAFDAAEADRDSLLGLRDRKVISFDDPA